MGDTKIEWATKVWNPVTGCTPVSAGCANCYARRMAYRFDPDDHPFSKVTFHPSRLDEPLRWRKQQRVFVCSMGDLFHMDVEHGRIVSVFSYIEAAPRHTFMILTKRPVNMLQHFRGGLSKKFPVLPNLWLGVSVEDQKTADERIPILLQAPAARRFVSVEPMLGPVEIFRGGCPHPIQTERGVLYPPGALSWVICGGESGPGARPMHPDWARSLRDQCKAAEVPYWFKQWGEYFPCPLDNSDDPGTPWRRFPDGHRAWGLGEASQPPETWPQVAMLRVGKKAGGCLLDGREWKEIPE